MRKENIKLEGDSKIKKSYKLSNSAKEKILKRKRTMSVFSYNDTNNIINKALESILCTDPFQK